MAETAKRGRGRPPKPVAERKRNNLTMRLRDDSKEMLSREAEKNRRSLSEEAEARIERSVYQQDLLSEVLELRYGKPFAGLLLMLADVMVDAAKHAAVTKTHLEPGSSRPEYWLNDPYAFHQMIEAAREMLDAARPDGEVNPNSVSGAVADALGWSDDEVERRKAVEAEKPRTLAIEMVRTIQGKATMDWFQDSAARIKPLLGPLSDHLKEPAVTREIADHESKPRTKGVSNAR